MVRFAGPLLLLAVVFMSGTARALVPAKVAVNGVTLHYVESGRGEPLILLHGGQGDYRSWGPQIEELSKRFRVISYSRRYNFPNENPVSRTYRSVYSDADDLAALIRHLQLGRVHLVGTSAGAVTALVLATRMPGTVRSLVLAEPPVHAWAREHPDGRVLYDRFMAELWEPAAAAFRNGDEATAMKVIVDGFGGAGRFDSLTPEARKVAMQNARFFSAATRSRNPFPSVDKNRVRRLRVPVMIITGERTVAIHKFVNAELARLLPDAENVTIPDAGHGSPRENPAAFTKAVTGFLARVSG